MTRQEPADLLLRKLMFNIATLEGLGRVLSSSEDFQGRLRTALSSIMGSLPVARGGFFLVHRCGDGEVIELVATRGVALAPGISLPLPGEVRNGLLAHGATVVRREPPSFLQGWLESFHLIFEGLQTEVIQPLVFKREILGLVSLGAKFNGDRFRAPDLELLRIMGNYTAIGLHNQQLLLNLERTNTALRRKAAENARLYADLQEIYMDTVRALAAAIDAKDPYTRGHSERVAHFAEAIARRMGLDAEEVKGLSLASHLHDIGKLAIDNSILCKPRKLNVRECAEIHRHPLISYDILSNIRFPYRDVALLTRHHHERLNGRGYPDGKHGEELTVGMKILALADAFDAMTSDRPYRPALTVEQALDEITRNVCVQFDRQVASAFLSSLQAEVEDGLPAHGILANMGKRCDEEHLSPVISRMIDSLEGAVAH